MADPRLLHVETVESLTPRLIRIVFGGEGLAGFAAGEFTDHYVKLQVPPRGADYAAPFDTEEIRAARQREQWPRTRTYTVAGWDREASRLTIDFVVHGDEGVAGPWAAAAQPGDTLQLQGPGGAYAPDPEADWHLMVARRRPARARVPRPRGQRLRPRRGERRPRRPPSSARRARDPARVRLDLRLLEADPDRGGPARGQAGVEPPRRGGPRRRALTAPRRAKRLARWPLPLVPTSPPLTRPQRRP